MDTATIKQYLDYARRPFIVLWRLLTSLSRSWLIWCTDFSVLPAVVLLGITVGLIVVFLNFNSAPLVVCLVFLLGILVGAFRAGRDVSFFLKRALELSAAEEPEQQLIHDEQQGTGLKHLDSLLHEQAMRACSLVDTVEAVKEENSRLIRRYEILTENLVAAVIIRDTEGGIAYCSPFTEVLTGYSLAEIYEAQDDFFLSIVHEEDRESYLRAHRVTAAGEAFQFRYRFFHKTGIPMWAETRTVPIANREGEVVSSLSITLDVTGAVRYQQQVEEKNRDLQDFTYMVTHDLKAPIYTLKGMVNLIEEDLGTNIPENLAEPLRHISNASHRLEELVTSVLEYSRITSLEYRADTIELNGILKEIQSDYSTQLKECGGNLEMEGNLPAVLGDRTRIYQVFSNLIGNAIKYRSEDCPLQIRITSQVKPESRYAKVVVSDNGSGIPADKLESVFRPFQRAHGADVEGSGIGLACVKKIVEKFGGRVEIESEIGKGSHFSLILKKPDDRADQPVMNL